MALKHGTNTISTAGQYVKHGTNSPTTVKHGTNTVWTKQTSITFYIYAKYSGSTFYTYTGSAAAGTTINPASYVSTSEYLYGNYMYTGGTSSGSFVLSASNNSGTVTFSTRRTKYTSAWTGSILKEYYDYGMSDYDIFDGSPPYLHARTRKLTTNAGDAGTFVENDIDGYLESSAAQSGSSIDWEQTSDYNGEAGGYARLYLSLSNDYVDSQLSVYNPGSENTVVGAFITRIGYEYYN